MLLMLFMLLMMTMIFSVNYEIIHRNRLLMKTMNSILYPCVKFSFQIPSLFIDTPCTVLIFFDSYCLIKF